MFVHIQKLLDEEQVETLEAGLAKATFAEAAAASASAMVKDVLQLDKEKSKAAKEMDTVILSAIANNQMVRSMAMPARIFPPVYVKQAPGSSDGPRVDAPVMPGNPPVRTDVSLTVFLSDPESYEGGEWATTTEVGEAKFKLPRGDALMHPTGAPHSVAEVTKGERIVALTWVQSSVRDPARRHLLFDLEMANQLVTRSDATSQEARLLRKTQAALLRMWAEV